ncbi:hypothetical protein EZV62_021888 [Acer yangbiense]|uniref:Probable purine permease n=1 Tax=Acer yangbiense TaxID=1000413 RepID=A0A5C7H7K7_9ROSI|nr:hypothetical protein EZV62_021888 [Acer yangbiense]
MVESMDTHDHNNSKKRALLVLNCILLTLGSCGGPMLGRLYFLHGGKRVWFSSCLLTASWPVILIPITINYYMQRRDSTPSSPTKPKLFSIKPPIFLAAAVIGVLTGLDDYLYAYGVARLPVSTSSLIIASQLAFTAGFAFLLVKQKFTSYSINAVFLLTIGAGVLALHTTNDRPNNESNKQYMLGFLMTLAAAVLYGFVLPLIELTYKNVKQKLTYSLVMEIQLVISFFATALCTIGMLINKDFQAIGREAKEYELGEAKYYVVVVVNSLTWQCFFMGSIGVIFCTSSLLSGILIAVLLPITEVLAVIFYSEKFQAEKGVSLALSIWGFVSYFYGEIKHSKTKEKEATQDNEMPQLSGRRSMIV